MLRLLKIEWNKIYYYKTARVFTILYFIMLALVGLILAFLKFNIGGIRLDLAKLGMFNFPVVWQNVTFIVAIGKLFIAIIIITNVTNEYSNGTLKQNLIDGMSKKEFISSKVITNFTFALLSTIFVFLTALTLGFAFSGNEDSIFQGLEFIGTYFLKLFLFFSICLFMAILLRKSAFAFLGIIILWMAEGGITLIEFFIKAWQAGGFQNIDPYGFYISNYLPLNVSSKLIDFPKINLEGFVMGGSIFKYTTVDWTFVVAALIYITIFLFLSFRLLKKRDL